MIDDDPIIKRIERTGYGYKDTKQPVCPVCGEVCETFYKDEYGDILGCDECITVCDAWDEEECLR